MKLPDAARRFLGGGVAATLLAALFLVLALATAGSHGFNYDEGVVIAQAREIQAGRLPFADFFYHQPPLYPFALALLASPAPDALLAYRLPSLLATALCGVLLWAMARRWLGGPIALLAPLLFYSAPLQFYGALAMPHALFLACSTAGIYLLYFATRGGGAARDTAGAGLLATAILLKPLAISTALAAGLTLLAARRGWLRAARVAAAGLGIGLVAWVVFDRLGDGGFSEIVSLQLGRYASRGGFELFRQFPPVAQALAQLSLDSAVAFNLHELQRVFIVPDHHGHLPLLVLALFGLGALLRGGPHASAEVPDPAAARLLWATWLAIPLAFGIWVWEPSFDHYFLQYLPPLTLLATFGAATLWRTRRAPWLGRSLAALLVAASVGSGLWHERDRRVDYAAVPRPAEPGETWLTFDPLIHFLNGTRFACGIFDPFNTYGRLSLLGGVVERSEAPVPERWQRFYVSEQELRSCLEQDPEIRLALGDWAQFFLDARLRAFLDGLERERFVALPSLTAPAQARDAAAVRTPEQSRDD